MRFYHIKADLKIDTPYLQGEVLCRFESTRSDLQVIRLNLHDAYTVDSISDGISSYVHSNDSLIIHFQSSMDVGEQREIIIRYHGIPQRINNLKGLRYDLHGNNEPIIATLCTPFLAHTWWPCKDGPGDKADSVYVDITIPDTTVNGIGMTAVSNGILEKTTHSNGKSTFHWRHRYPIVPYYVMMAISNYIPINRSYTSEEGSITPLTYYVFQDHFNDAVLGVEALPDVMKCFSSLFGDYPFSREKYGMTQLGYYGGIENQTNTIINQMSQSWFEVSVHELAHMWFGDMITCEDWHHAWLNEGFATYCEALWSEYENGFDAYRQHPNQSIHRSGHSLSVRHQRPLSDIHIHHLS